MIITRKDKEEIKMMSNITDAIHDYVGWAIVGIIGALCFGIIGALCSVTLMLLTAVVIEEIKNGKDNK